MPQNLIILSAVIVAIFFISYAYSNITFLTHIAEHSEGECHLDAECKVGEICIRECMEYRDDGLCEIQAELGKCHPIDE